MKFTNKTEYLAWRAQWRKDYAKLTKTTQKYKQQRKDKDPSTRSMAQMWCAICRKKAGLALEERKQSKILAQQQYLAARDLVAS